MVLVGLSNVAFFTTANSFLQVHADPLYRGRVTAFYSLLFGGMTPVGSLLAGTLVEAGGPQLGFAVTGSVLLLTALTIVGIRLTKYPLLPKMAGKRRFP
jgi:MFS family permease